ncbi:MAG: right-handed parallel beta-helix repeat-containing protein [Anaerolineales bacterium]|nr:right-handed parallel beta-helix repeat-containing protein [Anaerolineales bacterium]
MKKLIKGLLWVLGGLLLVLAVVVLIVGLIPVPKDEAFDPAEYGAGSSTIQPSYTGLQREFPAINGEVTPEKAELGKILFFDPVLSAQNDISCAHCHHPDYGFADGLPVALGEGAQGAGPQRSGGTALARNTISLWNVGYTQIFFWDGHATSLEEQAVTPLTHPDEMAADPEALATELAALPGYVDLFKAAFGDDHITPSRINEALAVFERTLTSNDSPFDHYATGEVDALTASQRRGLNLFRSAATRCFECHAAPTFSTDSLRVIGVPDGEASTQPFKVPSLRNVVLSAPYMHNGSLATLEEVVEFYANAGGTAHGIEGVDPFVLGFKMTDQEKADLVAFLYALTDESAMPETPSAVPSGLPVVEHQTNPARDLVTAFNPGTAIVNAPPREPQTFTVQPGERIQAVVDQAQAGDTILLAFGTYHERVVIDLNDITLLGIANEAGDWPTMDGEGVLPEAVVSSGNHFEVGNLRVVNYTSTGILVEGATGVHMHHMYAENTGIYGLYPVRSTDVLIEDSLVIGTRDAGIYAGQSEKVVIRNNEVYGNVLGIEAENTVDTEIYGNHAHDNTMGILVVLLPNLTSKVNLYTKVYDNLIENNNIANFADAGTAAAIAPPGSGIALIGVDYAEVYNNTIRGNKTAGVGVFDLAIAFERDRINVPTRPEFNRIYDNTFANNGYEADAFVAELGIPGADILWDVSGVGNQFNEAEATTFPPALPSGKWPGIFYTAYWQILNFLMGML